MKKVLLFRNYCLKSILLLGLLFLYSNNSWGQQVIGTFPYMNGGFEGQTPTTLGTALLPTSWSRQSNTGSTGSVTTTSPRTGSNCGTHNNATSPATATRAFQSPQLTPFDAANSPTASTAYMVQFWVRNAAAVTAFQAGINTNGTSNSSYSTATTLPINSSWAKYTTPITTSSATITSSAVAIIGRCTAGVFDIDDVVIYPGSTVDSTAPDPPTTTTFSSVAASQQTISWTAPATGVDGGGYMVVRSTADPTTVPNANGIYAVGNFVAGTEKVVYLGTTPSFNDTGLSPSTQYFYRIYTVDKAFNYSSPITANNTTTAPSYAAEPTSQASNIIFSNVSQTGFTVNWTAGNVTNSLVVVKSGSAVNADPSDGNTYSSNSGFGSGTLLGTGNYVVYNGTGNSVSITGLSKAITYYVKVYTFNGSGGSENYLITNPASSSQMTTPGEIVSTGLNTTSTSYSTASAWVGGVAPTQYDNVTIVAGDIFNIGSAQKCYNLTINSGGKLASATAQTLQIYGNSLVCNGTFGDPSATASILTTEFGGNLTISGSGSIYPYKIRPVTGLSNIGVTFDANTTLTYTTVCLQSDNGSNDNIIFNINSGKTLTLAGSLSTTSSQTGVGTATTTVNVNGTVNIGSSTSGTLNTTVAVGKSYNLNINGNLTTYKLNITPSHAVQSPTIIVTSPGSLTATGTVDASNTTITGAVTGTGTFNLNSTGSMNIAAPNGLEPVAGPIRTTNRNFTRGSSYSFVGSVPQVNGADLPSSISNLTINNAAGVTLEKATDLTGKLTVTSGNFNTGGFLTLKSVECCTASVAPVLGTISGNVTVERYIPAKRAWRALTSPVNTTNSISTNWQEGGVTGNGINGFDIWSSSGGTGIISGGSGSSLMAYNSSSNNWSGITDTTTSSSLLSGGINKPFMAFVTGPFGSNNVTNNLAAATTIRATGTLFTGTQTYPTTGSQYTFIGNPYASSLSLTAMLSDSDNSTDFNNGIWIWDSNGNASVGSYNYFDKVANAYSYPNSSSPASNPINALAEIQSGQAFFVKSSTGTGASFSIKEVHKGTTVNNVIFRDAAPAELFRVGLYKQENNEWSGRDGAMTVILSNSESNQDANKMVNSSENIAFVKNGTLYASEHHLPLVANDVLNIRVWKTTAGATYKLKLNTEEFTSSNLEATLEDLFTNSRTPLALDGTAVEYPFTVTTDALSTGDRFRIVFQSSLLGTTLPTASGFSIIPNPVTGDSFQVNLGTLATGAYSYSICNAIGQEVAKGTINNTVQNTNYEVKMSNSATGIYIMKIKGSDNSVFTAKIIKK